MTETKISNEIPYEKAELSEAARRYWLHKLATDYLPRLPRQILYQGVRWTLGVTKGSVGYFYGGTMLVSCTRAYTGHAAKAVCEWLDALGEDCKKIEDPRE